MPSSCSRVPFDLYTSSLSFPSPPFSLVLLSRHGRSQVIWSHITCQRACELSLFMNWLQWESSLGAPRAEDREDPRGADFKAISCLGWNQNWEISEMLSRKATGHMCVCECIMYCMSETFHRGMTGAKSYQFELKSFEIFDPLNVPVFTLLYVSDAGTQTFLFWTLQCKYESGTTRL